MNCYDQRPATRFPRKFEGIEGDLEIKFNCKAHVARTRPSQFPVPNHWRLASSLELQLQTFFLLHILPSRNMTNSTGKQDYTKWVLKKGCVAPSPQPFPQRLHTDVKVVLYANVN
jgi:hypothetical protein